MAKSRNRPSVLLVGVLPPPFHGQSLATKSLFEADLSPLVVFRTGVHSSNKLEEVGKASIGKAINLAGLVAKVCWQALRHRPRVLYYTAGSGAWVPFFRDVVFLTICRPLFRRTVIHYHSGDLHDFVRSSPWRNRIGRWIYGRGALTIKLGKGCPVPEFPESVVKVVPNGIEAPGSPLRKETGTDFRVLFLGNLFEDKGIFETIRSVGQFAVKTGADVRLKLVGSWPDESTRRLVGSELEKLPANVSWDSPSPAYGDEKWGILGNSDVLIFPTRYRRENLPLVIIEAMAAGLPVIATDWRGIPSLVNHGVTGFLVPTGDTDSLAESLETLWADPALRERMSAAALSAYQSSFTITRFVDRMRSVLLEVAEN